eukprot:1210720-Lingulodinium_polyedra.AAC.1
MGVVLQKTGSPCSPLVHCARRAFLGWSLPQLMKLRKLLGLPNLDPPDAVEAVRSLVVRALPKLSEAAVAELLALRGH